MTRINSILKSKHKDRIDKMFNDGIKVSNILRIISNIIEFHQVVVLYIDTRTII